MAFALCVRNNILVDLTTSVANELDSTGVVSATTLIEKGIDGSTYWWFDRMPSAYPDAADGFYFVGISLGWCWMVGSYVLFILYLDRSSAQPARISGRSTCHEASRVRHCCCRHEAKTTMAWP